MLEFLFATKNCTKKQFLSFDISIRMIQSCQTDLSDPESRRLAAEEERLSLVVCTCCHLPFSLLYRRRLVCTSCALGVCRACASFSPHTNTWICSRCHSKR